jgi:hypothetical protein
MAIADETGWERLFHALGPAGDLPAILTALCGSDSVAAGEAFAALWPLVFAGGRLTPATPKAVRHLVSVLHDPALGAGDHTIRPGVLFLLREIARVTADAEEVRHHAAVDGNVQDWLAGHLAHPSPPAVHEWSDGDGPGRVLLHNAVVDSFGLLPQVFAAVWPIPAAWPARTRVMAAAATAMLVRHPELADRRSEVIAYHQETARHTADRHDCAGLVLGLGELGVAPRDWLDDPRLAVRTCAALAPALADDAEATEVLIRAAEHPRAFDHSFTEPFVAPAYRVMCPPQLQEGPHRVLIRTVCERVGDFGRLFHAALAAADLRGFDSFAVESGPYLRRAFPAGLVEDGTATGEQIAFAEALASRDELWKAGNNRAAEAFAAAGLPHDRERWRSVRSPVVLDSAGRPTYEGLRLVSIPPVRLVRESTRRFFSANRTDPDLMSKLLSALSSRGDAVTVEGPRQFSMTVPTDDVPELDVDELVRHGLFGPDRIYGLGLAALLSLWVSVYRRHAGIEYRQQFVDGMPAGPIERLGPADHDDGYRFVFELDPDWLPRGARLPA